MQKVHQAMAGKQENNYRGRGLECWGDLTCSKSYQFCSLIRLLIRQSALNASLNGLGDQKQGMFSSGISQIKGVDMYIKPDISRTNFSEKLALVLQKFER